jgi:hypothetical protein
MVALKLKRTRRRKRGVGKNTEIPSSANNIYSAPPAPPAPKKSILPDPKYIPAVAYLVIGVSPDEDKTYIKENMYYTMNAARPQTETGRHIQVDVNDNIRMNSIGLLYKNRFDIIMFDLVMELTTQYNIRNIHYSIRNIIMNLEKMLKPGGKLIMNQGFQIPTDFIKKYEPECYLAINKSRTTKNLNEMLTMLTNVMESGCTEKVGLLGELFLRKILPNGTSVEEIKYKDSKTIDPVIKRVYNEHESRNSNDRSYTIKKVFVVTKHE